MERVAINRCHRKQRSKSVGLDMWSGVLARAHSCRDLAGPDYQGGHIIAYNHLYSIVV
jgi:hypothetical protein